jgi:hypothetical protein
MAGRWRLRFLQLTAGALVVAICGLWFIQEVFHEVDYGKLPPAQVFQLVWKRPLPTSVQEIRCAGHSSGQSANVWMRLRAPQETIKALVGASERISREEFQMYCSGREKKDSATIGWDATRSLDGTEYLHFDATSAQAGWYGVMAVHRRKGILYLFAEVL